MSVDPLTGRPGDGRPAPEPGDGWTNADKTPDETINDTVDGALDKAGNGALDEAIDETGDELEPVLPEQVRNRVVSLASDAMTALPTDEVPPPLRKVAKFAPHRRARLGAAPIATQLAGDARFRQQIAVAVRDRVGDLATTIAEGTNPGAADPVEVAALAYLLRPANWRGLLTAAESRLRAEADAEAVAAQVREAEARASQAEYDREVARVEADKLRAELSRVREDLKSLRDQHRETARSLREAQAREKRANDLLATAKGRAARATADHEAELRRLRGKLAETEAAVGAARSAAKDSRTVDDARLWLLLETITQAATGLRRELALEPATVLPADVAAQEEQAQRPGAGGRPRARAMADDDPARLDQLLALPRAHLLVDGYNVTKRGYGDLDLEQQRNRLTTGLAAIAAQTGAEVTVVFDGADRVPGLPPAPRGVRLLFSRKGQTADDLIRALVRAEPNGRPVVVVSSDREVADGVRRAGAYPLPSDALLRRLATR